MKTKLGMPTLIELPDIMKTVDLCKELGLSFIELNMNMPEFCPEKLTPELVKKLSKNKDIGFTLHLPEEIDLASFHPAIRQGNMERCCEAIIWASEAGINLVNMHINSGIYFTLPDQRIWIYDKYKQKFLDNVMSGFDKILRLAKSRGVTVCVENSSNFHYPFILEAVEKLVLMGEVCFTWDTGHDAKTGFKEKGLLTKYKNRIRHMHLHDYKNGVDHQPLFSGEIDIRQMLSFATNNGIRVVIEVKTIGSLKESLTLLNDANALLHISQH